jgi:hypothetical protein
MVSHNGRLSTATAATSSTPHLSVTRPNPVSVGTIVWLASEPMFFVPSMNETVYQGSFATMHGVTMSEAFKSTLDLSFEVRGGLLMRQIHHWAAVLFMAAIVTHMFRVFFTGAFRKPREINWVVGFTLLTLGLLAATFTINPIWSFGPYDPSPVSAGAQPDWYMLFLEGGLRLTPGWTEFVLGGFTWSFNILIPGVIVPGILFTTVALYPFIESWVTGDKREHHILDRPRNAPVRTGIGVALLISFLVLALAGSNDIIATHFHLSINDITMFFGAFNFLGPILGFWITKRLCLGLQRRDRELVLHGHETGRILRFADGETVEVHKPLNEDERWLRVQHESRRPLQIAPEADLRGVVRRGYRKDLFRQRISRFFFQDRIEPVTPAELAAAHADASHDVRGAIRGAGNTQVGADVPPIEPAERRP